MNISELSVRRPILMTMVYLAILLVCFVFVPNLDIALYPSVDMPIISVVVDCGDNGPDVIMNQVGKKLEDSLYSLEDLSDMTSYAQNGRLMIMLEFDYGTDLDEAEDKVNSSLSFVTRMLPDWVQSTSVVRMDSMMSTNSEILSLTLSGQGSLEDLKNYADDNIAPLLERVSGVSEVSTRGGFNTVYEISVNPERLYAYGLTLSSVTSALADRNNQQYLGSVEHNNIEYEVSTDSRFVSPDEIGSTIISGSGDKIVRLSDVATVKLSEEQSSRSWYNGKEVVSLSVSNESDTNATSVATSVKEEIKKIQESLPSGYELTIDYDSTQMISSTMDEVYKSAYEGVLLAALIIFLFLRNIKATLIISLSMPICILITLMLMSIFSISINSLSMVGLILAIGMIVDASVIILENTFSYRERGYRSAVSAILGSRNMLNAIVASTLTTLCVFIPMLLYKNQLGMIGVMVQDMVITVCISMVCSLFVAVTLVPALAGSILRINTRTQKPLKNKLLRGLDNGFAKTEEGLSYFYSKSLDYVLSHKALFILLLVLALVLSTMALGDMNLALMPNMPTDDTISLSLELPEGTVSGLTTEKLFEMQDKIEKALPAESYESISIRLDESSSGSITINLPDITEQKYSADELKNMIRPFISEDPEATWSFGSGRGPMSSNAVDIEIKSEDEDLIESVANQIVVLLNEKTDKLRDISSDISDGSPRLEINVDYDKAKELGVSISSLQSALYTAINGSDATEVSTFDSSTTYSLNVSLKDAIEEISDLQSLSIPASGSNIRLDQVASFEYGTSPKSINRENRETINHVTASASDGVSAEEASEIASMIISENLILPDGVEISYGGEMASFDDYLDTMVIVIALALALVYMVMAAQFESLIDPFIIFATIPLLLIGVVIIHIAMGMDFSLFSIIGIVALLGVVVNNGIVLVDAINQLVRQHVKVRDACLIAARSRLRPILMTTLTTILGLVPMAFFPGEGSEMLQPIAVTFLGGIITGAFLTLFLSPSLYLIFNKRREKKYDNPDTLNNQLLEFDTKGAVKATDKEDSPDDKYMI